jgi:hypothetical protein
VTLSGGVAGQEETARPRRGSQPRVEVRRRTIKSLAQRYAIAAVGFAAAAVWLGVGLVKGLECLLAFVSVSLLVAVFQRRGVVAKRRQMRLAVRPASNLRRRRRADDARDQRRAKRAELSPWPKRSRYEDEVDSGEWPWRAESRP